MGCNFNDLADWSDAILKGTWPPPGYTPAPDSQRGAVRKRLADGSWDYKYPEKQTAKPKIAEDGYYVTGIGGFDLPGWDMKIEITRDGGVVATGKHFGKAVDISVYPVADGYKVSARHASLDSRYASSTRDKGMATSALKAGEKEALRIHKEALTFLKSSGTFIDPDDPNFPKSPYVLAAEKYEADRRAEFESKRGGRAPTPNGERP